MNDDNSLDLLDLDDNGAMDTLPEATPFAAPRPKKPWLLLGIILSSPFFLYKSMSTIASGA